MENSDNTQKNPRTHVHDINNCLVLIVGLTDMMLLDMDESDPKYEDIASIKDAAVQAADMGVELLTMVSGTK